MGGVAKEGEGYSGGEAPYLDELDARDMAFCMRAEGSKGSDWAITITTARGMYPQQFERWSESLLFARSAGQTRAS